MSDATKRSALHAGRPSRPTGSFRASKPIPSFLAWVGTPRASAQSRQREPHLRPHVRPAGWPCVRNACFRMRGRLSGSRMRDPSRHPLPSRRSMPSCCTFVGVVRFGRRESGIGCHGRATSMSDSRRRIPASCPFLGIPFRRQAGRPAGVRTPWLSIFRRLDFVSNQPLRVTNGTPGQPCLRD